MVTPSKSEIVERAKKMDLASEIGLKVLHTKEFAEETQVSRRLPTKREIEEEATRLFMLEGHDISTNLPVREELAEGGFLKEAQRRLMGSGEDEVPQSQARAEQQQYVDTMAQELDARVIPSKELRELKKKTGYEWTDGWEKTGKRRGSKRKTKLAEKFIRVRFHTDVPLVWGRSDKITYGPFKKGVVGRLPIPTAKRLITEGRVSEVKKRKKPKAVKIPKREKVKPSLKQLMKGTVLTGFVEARRVRQFPKPKAVTQVTKPKSLAETILGKPQKKKRQKNHSVRGGKPLRGVKGDRIVDWKTTELWKKKRKRVSRKRRKRRK